MSKKVEPLAEALIEENGEVKYVVLSLCPFCGSSDIYVFSHGSDPDQDDLFSVVCDTCSAEGPAGRTKTIAAQRWNQRAPSSDDLQIRKYISDRLLDVAAEIFPVT